MLKFQVRKSETEATTNTNQTVTSNPTNAQIQVSEYLLKSQCERLIRASLGDR
jgi:hypothetical protein